LFALRKSAVKVTKSSIISIGVMVIKTGKGGGRLQGGNQKPPQLSS